MIATRDIGAAAADALLKLEFHGRQTRELPGHRDLNYNEVSAIIGKAIGRPGLKYIQAPNDQVRAGMVQSGMSDKLARLLLEMADGLNSGHVRALESRTPGNTTPTTFETFVAEAFAPAYKQQAAAVGCVARAPSPAKRRPLAWSSMLETNLAGMFIRL